MEAKLMEVLNINGVRYALNIHQHDSSLPCLFMLHGFMGDGRVFHHLMDDLCKACNPITVDLLGHGKSEKIYDATRYREEWQIADIAELVQQIGRSPVFLYGYSMGGRLALKTALAEPGLFEGLILESTNFGITNEEARAKRKEIDTRRAQKIVEDYEGFLKAWEELALFQSPKKVRCELLKTYEQIHLNQDPKAMAASLRGFGTGFMEPVRTFPTDYSGPVLLLVGSGDKKYIDISVKMQRLFNDAISCILEAGHRVHLDNPGEVAQKIIFFIDQNYHS